MSTVPAAESLRGTQRVRDWIGDRLLLILTLLAALASVVLMALIAWRVFRGASLSWSTFGLGFLTGTTWDATHDVYGAGTLLYGTAVTSVMALLIAGPLGIGRASCRERVSTIV